MYLVYYYLKSREITKNIGQLEDIQPIKDFIELFLLSRHF